MRLIILFRLGMIVCFAGYASRLLGQCPTSVNAGEDILLYTPPTPIQLNGDINGPYLNFSWIPTTGLTGFNTLTPTLSVTQNTTYILRARAINSSINLVSNGDFEGGNSGFTTDYLFNRGNMVPEGTYEVLDNPQSWHPGFITPCSDHTPGSGKMMVINGNGVSNQDVWCQTVATQPNTEYAFTAWAYSVVGTEPTILQFSVNGTNIGTTFGASSQLCNLQQFYTIWNSGGDSSATICVVNQNTALNGNDFGIDNIGLSPVCVVTDTVQVRVASVTAVASSSVSGGSGGGSSGGTGISIGGGLGGRKVRSRPDISNNTNDAGIVIVSVCVDSDGNVTSATPSLKGTTNHSPSLKSKALDVARQFKFAKGGGANDCGTIAFKFRVK